MKSERIPWLVVTRDYDEPVILEFVDLIPDHTKHLGASLLGRDHGFGVIKTVEEIDWTEDIENNGAEVRKFKASDGQTYAIRRRYWCTEEVT